MKPGAEFRHVSLKVPIKIHKAIRIWGIRNGLKGGQAYQALLKQWYDKRKTRTSTGGK